MRKNMTTWVLLLTLFIGELHSIPIFSDDPTKLENWIWRSYKPMTQAWNMQFVESGVIKIMYFLAFVLYRPTKVNNTTILTFLYASFLDQILYFYNFKDPQFFGSFYVWMALIWFLVYYWRTDKGILVKHLFPKRPKK